MSKEAPLQRQNLQWEELVCLSVFSIEKAQIVPLLSSFLPPSLEGERQSGRKICRSNKKKKKSFFLLKLFIDM